LEPRLIEFFQKRGYSVTTPRVLRGISGYNQSFDISTTKGHEEIVLDIAAGATEIGPESVVAFFAKIFDTKPPRPILVCIPALNHDAKSLATMYKIETVTGSDMSGVLSGLSEIFGPELAPSSSVATVSKKQSQLAASGGHGADEVTDMDRVLREARARMARLRNE
jgi:hypothetical protein